MFAQIYHIDQVLPEIEGRKEFIHVVKDGYQVVDYVYIDNTSFDTPIRKELRGLKFDMNGNIIGRAFQKFFNYGEREIKYDWSKPHTIMTKMEWIYGPFLHN